MCGIFFCTSLFLILNRHLTYGQIWSLYKPSVCQGLKDTMLPTFETSFNATVMVIQVKRSIYHSLMWLRLSVQIILNCSKKRKTTVYILYYFVHVDLKDSFEVVWKWSHCIQWEGHMEFQNSATLHQLESKITS